MSREHKARGPVWRERIRQVYPLACDGVVEAIKEYNRLMDGAAVKTFCVEPGCGIPIRSVYKNNGKCSMHQDGRTWMRKRLLDKT